MSGCLQDRRIEISGDVALHGGIWLARMLVVYDHGHAVGEHGTGQAARATASLSALHTAA